MRRRFKELYQNKSLRFLLWLSFTLTAVLITIFFGIFFYSQYSRHSQETLQEETKLLIEQVNNTLSSQFRSMMKVSDSLYYSVIKNTQFSQDSANGKFQLLYDTNKESIESISLFSEDGKLIETAPAGILKENIDVKKQDWFASALNETENMHFSLPSVQTLFKDTTQQYQWVLSLSREVEMTVGKEAKRGILLIDMKYDRLEQIFGNISSKNGGYIYLVDGEGNIIYHPLQQLIFSGVEKEQNLKTAGYSDGIYKEKLHGRMRMINVKTIGYTGWKIIGVTPQKGLYSFRGTLFIIFLCMFQIGFLFLLNSYISSKVTKPIMELEKVVQTFSYGKLDAKVDVTGPNEIRHLGQAIQSMADQIQNLMNDIVEEHEAKRKSELNALQSQINPHFLYNTLDVIVWMIENEKKAEAVKVVTALARFFRISLSKGKTIIPLEDELEHARNYLMIQQLRYKNRFVYAIEVQDSVKQLASIKLIIQPLVENSIYHGMEYMNGDGEIKIKAYASEKDLYIEITDNGPGMTEDRIYKLMDGEVESSKKGSGIGIRNVKERIRVYFGENYGLKINSEPDVGTTVIIHLPAIPYNEWKESGG